MHNRLLPSYVLTYIQLADIFLKVLGIYFGKLLVKLDIQSRLSIHSLGNS